MAQIYFPGNVNGINFDAVKCFLYKLDNFANVYFYFYRQRGTTFHPKLYLFSNVENSSILLIVGYSNWSKGVFVTNVEANALIKLNLNEAEHQECYQKLNTIFDDYWKEITVNGVTS